MNEFEHLKIQLGVIKKATGDFSNEAIIGRGAFGKVYKGEVSHFKGRSMVAIKRLDRKSLQGVPEFMKEIMMLSRYTHKNLISLLGFCDEDGEKILVYELACNGSLDRHLSSINLTWAQRIKICLDAAKGLSYLHDPRGTQQRILHRDIKSANILLDHDWNAKLSDMGLSKLGPANQLHTLIFTDIVGTPVYCDPQYMTTYTLTKESDVYSFGVVLFEVLCGRLCFVSRRKGELREVQVLVPMWKECFRHKKLDEIIFKNVRSGIDKTSLETLANIAFQCVHESREQRPEISLVVKQLEIAFKFQERYEMKLSKKLKLGVEEMIKAVKTWPKDRYLEDLISNDNNLGKTKGEEAKQKDVEGSGGHATKDRKGTPPPQGPVQAVTTVTRGWSWWFYAMAVAVVLLVVLGCNGGWWWVVMVVGVGATIVTSDLLRWFWAMVVTMVLVVGCNGGSWLWVVMMAVMRVVVWVVLVILVLLCLLYMMVVIVKALIPNRYEATVEFRVRH